MTIDVLLVDDHPVVLDGVAAALAQQPDLRVVARATNIEEGRAALEATSPLVALVDIRLPDGSGLDLVAESVARGTRPAWVVLSSFESPQYLATALELGAVGYLLKTAPTGEIVAAIRAAARGSVVFTAAQLAAARRSGVVRLAPLDRGIVKGLLEGKSNDEIGAGVGVAERTVEVHLSRLYARLGVASRTELALLAEREGLLDLQAE
jgi:DNA-binding NarL/FixJ family response regulator